MERGTDIAIAKQLFKENFIGADELHNISANLGINIPAKVPKIHFSRSLLEDHARDYILILGVNKMNNGEKLSLLTLIKRFGSDASVATPCFYNQDWYLKENFLKRNIQCKWYLIRKKVFEDSRAVLPTRLQKKFNFPSAVLCAYTFFAVWFHAHKVLWKYDFVWCSDFDHNGDRIYVGKYIDKSGVNKNGFSIHRNLTLRRFYAAVNIV